MEENKLQGVADTLYIPLTARIFVSKRFPDFFCDRKSLELESALPGDSIGRRISLYSRVAMRVARHGRFRSALYHLALS